MKITTFNPMIVSNNPEEVIKLFEDLGFEKRHQVTVEAAAGATDVRMTDPSGFHVDVAQAGNLPNDMTMIRLNVDNFDEAYQILLNHGFVNNRGDATLNTDSVKSASMFSPTGIIISLVEHIKD